MLRLLCSGISFTGGQRLIMFQVTGRIFSAYRDGWFRDPGQTVAHRFESSDWNLDPNIFPGAEQYSSGASALPLSNLMIRVAFHYFGRLVLIDRVLESSVQVMRCSEAEIGLIRRSWWSTQANKEKQLHCSQRNSSRAPHFCMHKMTHLIS